LYGFGKGGLKMSRIFERIRQGLREAIEFREGKASRAIVHEVDQMDVKAIRGKVGMSEAEFTSAFGISMGTLRHWERGDRTPRGPARVLLNVVPKGPKAALRSLSQKP
jgi:putative transcriptional regulator